MNDRYRAVPKGTLDAAALDQLDHEANDTDLTRLNRILAANYDALCAANDRLTRHIDRIAGVPAEFETDAEKQNSGLVGGSIPEATAIAERISVALDRHQSVISRLSTI